MEKMDVHLQNLGIRVLSQVTSSSLAERNWSTCGFVHSVKRNRLGSQKAKDLVYVHSNLCLAPRRGPEYGNGPSNEWAVDRENPDLDLSLAALNIEYKDHRSGIGQTSSLATRSTAKHASVAIFDEDSDNEY